MDDRAPAPAAATKSPAAIDLTTPPPDCKPCTRRPHEQAEGSGGFLLGVALIDLSSLNDRLEQNGYTRLSGPFTFMGGEGHGVMDSGFVVGVRGAAIFGPDGDGPGGMSTSMGGGFGMLDLGFALVRTRPALLTLTAGIGGYGMSLDIQDDQSARFDDVLADPRRGTSLGRGGLLVGLTLGFDGRVPVGEAEEGQQGFFTLGGRLGALYGPAFGDWDLPGGGNASSGPGFGLTGGFAALVIGFGGRPTEGIR
jgi:hypothetical protein